jgi:hypothetical protein
MPGVNVPAFSQPLIFITSYVIISLNTIFAKSGFSAHHLVEEILTPKIRCCCHERHLRNVLKYPISTSFDAGVFFSSN